MIPRGMTTLPAAVVMILILVVIGGVTFLSQPERFALPDTDDPVIAVSAIAQRHIHGYRDDHEPIERLTEIAATEPVITTCGPTSVWAVHLLTEAGFEARVVTTLTLDEWDSLDNGHTLIEVREGDGWAVYDVDRGVRYTADGEPLSMAGVSARLPDDYEIVSLLEDPVGEGYIRASNARLLQVPAVGDGEFYWFASEDERIETYSPWYRLMDPDEWVERFYDGSI